MPVYVRQLNNGEQSGSETVIAPQHDGQADEALLELKRASHQGKGWNVEPTGNGFHAWKVYEGWGRKDRYFEVRG
jgi:hypothetical protein